MQMNCCERDAILKINDILLWFSAVAVRELMMIKDLDRSQVVCVRVKSGSHSMNVFIRIW